MLYALIDSGGAIRRRETFDGPAPQLAPAKGLRWVTDAPPAYDPTTHVLTQVAPVTGNAVTYLLTAIPAEQVLAAAKLARRQAVSDLRRAREAAGRTIAGQPVPIDTAFRLRLRELAADIGDGAASVAIQRADGAWATLTAAQFSALGAAVRAFLRDCQAAERTHHEALDALTTAAAINAYDITTGWPP